MGGNQQRKKTIPGLFDCCEDSELCCSLLCFPCVVYEKNHRQLLEIRNTKRQAQGQPAINECGSSICFLYAVACICDVTLVMNQWFPFVQSLAICKQGVEVYDGKPPCNECTCCYGVSTFFCSLCELGRSSLYLDPPKPEFEIATVHDTVVGVLPEPTAPEAPEARAFAERIRIPNSMRA